jgi:hypothetical protein
LLQFKLGNGDFRVQQERAETVFPNTGAHSCIISTMRDGKRGKIKGIGCRVNG